MDATARRRWADQWKEASQALDAQRRRELRTLTAERALAASEALLALGSTVPLSHRRRTHSGLVEQQRLLHKRGFR